MSDHEACIKEAEFLRKNLAESKASQLNTQRQLMIKASGMDFALKAGENAARRADVEIGKLNDVINQLQSVIDFVVRDKDEGYKKQLMKLFPVLDGSKLK